MKQLFSLGRGRSFSLMLIAFTAVLALAACSDSKSNRRVTPVGFIQFYNASQNAPAIDFVMTRTLDTGVESKIVAKADFGDATYNNPLVLDDYELTVERKNPANLTEKITVFERDITVAKNDYSFWVMSGDFAAPELTEYRYRLDKSYSSGQFGATVFNVTQGRGQIELYYVAAGGSFDDAQFLVTLGDGGQSDPVTMPAGDYTFFAVDVDSGNTILTTAAIPFVKANTYFLMLREVGFGDGSRIVLDQVTSTIVGTRYPSATNFVKSYADVNGSSVAEVRGYNSIDDLGSVDISFTKDANSSKIAALDVDQWSSYLSLASGSYFLAMTGVDNPNAEHVKDLVLSLIAGKKINIFFYKSTTGVVKAIGFDAPQRIRLYESDVNLISLANLLNDDGNRYFLKAYFVNEAAGEVFRDPVTNEIKSTAAQVLTKVDFATLRRFPLVEGEYVIYFTYTSSALDADNKTVLTENEFTNPVNLSVQAGEHYFLTLEPDAMAVDGYQLKVSN